MAKALTKIGGILERILRIILDSIWRMFHRKLTDEKFNSLVQFVKFGIVGTANTLISYFVYLLFLKIVDEKYYIFGNILGFFVSVLNAFYWNNKYVFKQNEEEKRSKLKAFIKVFVSYAATGLILSNILLVIFVNVFNISKAIGPLLVLLVTIPLNFIMNKIWAFKNTNHKN